MRLAGRILAVSSDHRALNLDQNYRGEGFLSPRLSGTT